MSCSRGEVDREHTSSSPGSVAWAAERTCFFCFSASSQRWAGKVPRALLGRSAKHEVVEEEHALMLMIRRRRACDFDGVLFRIATRSVRRTRRKPRTRARCVTKVFRPRWQGPVHLRDARGEHAFHLLSDIFHRHLRVESRRPRPVNLTREHENRDIRALVGAFRFVQLSRDGSDWGEQEWWAVAGVGRGRAIQPGRCGTGPRA